VKGKLGSRFEVDLPVRSAAGRAPWLIHPDYREGIDVVALPLPQQDGADLYPINRMPSKELVLAVGMDVFIVGYPYAIGPAALPVWKRGSIASEPQVLDPERPYMLIDTATRSGMSGSPVIRRSWGDQLLEDGSIETSISKSGVATGTRFVGVYSGRLKSSDPRDAQLGLCWPAHFVQEIIAGGC
jgi:hypothetical protein